MLQQCASHVHHVHQRERQFSLAAVLRRCEGLVSERARTKGLTLAVHAEGVPDAALRRCVGHDAYTSITQKAAVAASRRRRRAWP